MKGFARRSVNQANGGFSDDQMAEILRKERAMIAWNERRRDDVPQDLVSFVFIQTARQPGTPRVTVTWQTFLRLSKSVDNSYRGAVPPWPGFPATTADIEKIIAFRDASPA